MNLAIEYLQRSKTIRNFLQPPCSLFLENDDGRKLVVTLEETIADLTCYLVKQWDVWAKVPDDPLPRYNSCLVPKSAVFADERVVPEGYRPIQYTEEPVDTSNNTFKKPMPEELYEFYCWNYLNAKCHKATKEDWIWDVYMAVHHPDMDLGFSVHDLIFYKVVMKQEQKLHLRKIPASWHRWCLWKKHLIPDDCATVATELIFSH